MHNRICNTLDEGKNFWKEMKSLRLIPKVSDALHGFSPDELNLHFSNISNSPLENPTMSLNIVNNSSPEGFAFHAVTINEVILAVSHFRSQAKGDAFLRAL